jgi:hypothetical protein
MADQIPRQTPDFEMLAYVTCSAALLGLPLAPAQAERVAQQLERTALMAQQLDALKLAPDHELAEIYCPLAFPLQATQEQQDKSL